MRLVRYGMVGLGSFAVFATISSLPVSFPTIPPPYATGAGVMAAGVINFLGHRRFTFMGKRPLWESLPRYCILIVFNSLLGAVIVSVLTGALSVPILIANFVSLAVITAISYLLLAKLIV